MALNPGYLGPGSSPGCLNHSNPLWDLKYPDLRHFYLFKFHSVRVAAILSKRRSVSLQYVLMQLELIHFTIL